MIFYYSVVPMPAMKSYMRIWHMLRHVSQSKISIKAFGACFVEFCINSQSPTDTDGDGSFRACQLIRKVLNDWAASRKVENI